MKEQVKAIKLTTGDEIVAKVEQKPNGKYKLHNPIRFMFAHTEAGLQLTAQPFLVLSDSAEFDIAEEQIVTMGNPVDDIYNAWNTQFGSGIVTPPEKHLIT